MFDIDESRYRRSPNRGSAERRELERDRKTRGPCRTTRASRNLQKSPTDRDKLAAGRCLPISAVQRHCVLLLRAAQSDATGVG